MSIVAFARLLQTLAQVLVAGQTVGNALQGQHFLDDSRYAHDDSVLRTGLWVMGANHNFFNTVWTPGGYPLSTSDDWGTASTDSVCGSQARMRSRIAKPWVSRSPQ